VMIKVIDIVLKFCIFLRSVKRGFAVAVKVIILYERRGDGERIICPLV
jgi:hypothetical protein